VPSPHSVLPVTAPFAGAVAPGDRTHCPYCALQCGIRLNGPAELPVLTGDADFPVNEGALCIKGWTAAGALNHPDRLRFPLVRSGRGALRPASWDEALDRVATACRDAAARHGPDAIGVFGGGGLTNEKAYLLGKFARVALGTSQVDYNGRFCMSSAAAAALRAFGLDRGLPFPVAEVASSDALLLVGANPAETMPPFMRHVERMRAAGGSLLVADPRRTATARAATLHLPLVPGTDTALANGLLHVLVRDGLVDPGFVESRTSGFQEVRAVVAGCWPGRVERITGVPEELLVQAAHLLGRAGSPMVLTARGTEQQAQGVQNSLAWINLALALGRAGRPFTGWGCLTGQGNGQGGREHGQKADQLPGYRRLDDPAARRHVAAVWGVSESDLPAPGRSAFELLDALGGEGGIRVLLIAGSNPLVSAPDAGRIEARLRALDMLVVADPFLSETAELADVVLPVAQWAEEDGTMTSLEGRVLRRRRIWSPPPGVRTDLEVLSALAERLGRGRFFRHEGPRAVFEELRRASAGGPADYAGITWERLEQGDALHWPCPTEEHPGTPYPFAERFATPDGRARFHPVRHRGPAETPDGEFPLHLTTGRVLAQYQSGTQTRRLPELVRVAPSPMAELHPSVARRHGVRDGDAIVLVTRRGRAHFTARVTGDIRADTVFVPFHWGGEQSANRLTNPALDPTSRMPEFKVCAARLEHPSTPATGAST
jgi:assimilatory nitrate reductase catalytic subunit